MHPYSTFPLHRHRTEEAISISASSNTSAVFVVKLPFVDPVEWHELNELSFSFFFLYAIIFSVLATVLKTELGWPVRPVQFGTRYSLGPIPIEYPITLSKRSILVELTGS